MFERIRRIATWARQRRHPAAPIVYPPVRAVLPEPPRLVALRHAEFIRAEENAIVRPYVLAAEGRLRRRSSRRPRGLLICPRDFSMEVR